MRGVCLTYAMLTLEFLLHIPCFFIAFISSFCGEILLEITSWLYSSMGSFSYTSDAYFFFSLGSFSYTSRVGFVFVSGELPSGELPC